MKFLARWLDGGAKAALPKAQGGRTFCRDVVGESYYQEALETLAGGFTPDGCDVRVTAEVRPEPDNPSDPDAVRVSIGGRTVGYLSRGDAKRFVGGMAKLGRPGEGVSCEARIVGGWRRSRDDFGFFGVQLNLPWPLKLK